MYSSGACLSWREGRLVLDSKVDDDPLTKERETFRVLATHRMAASPARWRRVAIVLSGGGARGAYQAGALLALQDARVPTPIVTATSIGSINAAYYAASSATVVGNAEPLVQSWREISSPAIGIEWTRYVLMLAGLVAGVVGLGNLIRAWLDERGLTFVHLHDPRLTWLFLALAGISVSLLYDRLPVLAQFVRYLFFRRAWKPEKTKVIQSAFANAMVLVLMYLVFQPAHLHSRLWRIGGGNALTAVALASVAVVLIVGRLLRTPISLLSQKLLRVPFRTGLFSNLERTRFMRERVDLDDLHSSPMRVVITATDVARGSEQLFSNTPLETLAADPGADPSFVEKEFEPQENLMDAVTASSALPMFFEAVRVGKRLYTDGSVAAGHPIRPAIRLGADILFIIMTRSPNSNSEPATLKTFLDVGLRALDIVMVRNLRTDLKNLNSINQICEKYASEAGLRPEQMNVAIGDRVYRYVQVFTVCPRRPLPGSLIDFGGRTTTETILQGYRDGCEAVLALLDYTAREHPNQPKRLITLTLTEAP